MHFEKSDEPIELMMKADLIKKLEELLRDRPISEIVDEVHEIEDAYNAAKEEEEHAALEEAHEETDNDSEEETEESTASAEEEETPSEPTEEELAKREESEKLDARFGELIHLFQERLEKFEKAKKEEEEENYHKKKEVLAGLREVITEEQNIGMAIQKLRELQRQWKAIGNVPSDKYRELQNEYSFETERFNYTLSIYKDLKELDLQKNLELKQELVGKMKELLDEKSIKRTEMFVKALQEEWQEAGPVPQEEWEEVRDAFREATSAVYDKINKHYDELRERQKENLEKKQALVNRAKEESELDLRSPKKWNAHTDTIKELQQEWRKIGRAPRKENEEVWKEFRAACNTFFDRKRDYFKKLKEERDKNKAAKEELLKKAEDWKDSEDWKKATSVLINLQKEWKEVGAASRRDEQKLWTDFRAVCDHFFERKKHFFETMDERQEENLKAKQKIIQEVEAFEPGKDKKENLEKLKEFNTQWKAIGHIPKKKMDEINNAYRKALDEKYNNLGLGKREKVVAQYRSKIESIKETGKRKGTDLNKERRILRDRLRKTNDLIDKYETNISFFSVKGSSSPLLDQAKKKIEKAKQDAKMIEEKLKVLDKAFKQSKQNA